MYSTVDCVSSLKFHRKPVQQTYRIMCYFCYMIYFIAHICFGLEPQCGDTATEIKGTLGQLYTFKNVTLESGSESLTLQRVDKNKRRNLLIYTGSPMSQGGRYRYNEGKSSFEIENLQREDQGMYEIRVTHNGQETFCKYDLKVYEKINNVTVIVTHSLQNDSCNVTMDCVNETGDNIVFSWTENKKDLHHNNSILIVTIAKEYVNSNYSCQAENPVSKGSSEVNLMEICIKTPAASISNFDFRYLIIGLPILILIVIVAILIRKRLNRKMRKLHIHARSPQEMPPPSNPAPGTAVSEGLSTIYSVVQKKELATPRQRQVGVTVNDQAQRKKSEEIHTTVYDLAGPCTGGP